MKNIDKSKLIRIRRTKKDIKNRDYICGCQKTYASYPALFTHIKTKHNGKTPENTICHKRSHRGRPPKVIISLNLKIVLEQK